MPTTANLSCTDIIVGHQSEKLVCIIRTSTLHCFLWSGKSSLTLFCGAGMKSTHRQKSVSIHELSSMLKHMTCSGTRGYRHWRGRRGDRSAGASPEPVQNSRIEMTRQSQFNTSCIDNLFRSNHLICVRRLVGVGVVVVVGESRCFSISKNAVNYCFWRLTECDRAKIGF